MHYRRLGRSGLKLREIALGTWVTFGDQIPEKTAIQLIHTAYEAGINFFDNVDVYANGESHQIPINTFQVPIWLLSIRACS